MARQTQTSSSKAQTMTFGIEIETFVPLVMVNSGRIPRGAYHRGRQVPELPRGWTAESDCSLRTSKPGYTGVEIVSPVLKGLDGLYQVIHVMNWLRDVAKAATNRSCGTHVHVGVESCAGRDTRKRSKFVANLINVTAQYEWALRGAAGSRYRVQGSQYTRSIRNDSGYRAMSEHLSRRPLDLRSASSSKYRVLNLQHVNGRGTVEFRCFSGTTEAVKAISWIQMALAMCERALGRKASFDPREESSYRGGAAERKLDKFFYQAGWTLGRKDSRKAEVSVHGLVVDPALLDTMKNELRRLARKFDTACGVDAERLQNVA